MEDNFDALEVIARTRGKVEMDATPSRNKVFLIWGWPLTLFFTLQFAFWLWLHQVWCLFIWIGVPLVSIPLMMRALKEDRARTHIRTLEAKVVLDYWLFTGAVCGIGGFLYGFADLTFVCFYPICALLLGIGGFLTGKVVRFRPMVLGGLAGAVIGLGAFFLQEPLGAWQLLCVSMSALVSLVIPGHLYVRHFAHGV